MFVLINAAPTAAVAGDITLFGGYQDPGKLTLQSANDLLARPISIGVFGVRYRHDGIFSPEHTIAFAPNFIDSNSKAFIFNSNLLAQVPTPNIKPYLTAGLGTIIVKGSGLSDIGTKFAINYGGGVKLKAAGPVAARIDVRGYAIPSVQSQTLKATEVSFGLVFSSSR